MKVGRNDPCPCGSGAKFKRCHGGSRAEADAFERRNEALEEARGLAGMFPFLRVESPELGALADRVAAQVDLDAEIDEHVVRAGLALVGDAERGRLVGAYASRYQGPWRTLVDDVGDPHVAAQELAVGVVSATIHERLAPSRRMLEWVEHEATHPHEALAFVVPAAAVWSIHDASVAAEAAWRTGGVGEAWLRAIDRVADRRLEDEHVERARTLAARLARRLPLDGFPRASGLLTEACDDVARDDDAAAELAVTLLSSYVAYLGASAPGLAA